MFKAYFKEDKKSMVQPLYRQELQQLEQQENRYDLLTPDMVFSDFDEEDSQMRDES